MNDTIDLVMEGEFAGEFATSAARAARAEHIVRHVGTTRSVENATRMIKECHTPGVWHWQDGSMTVVDIRQK